jgi:hypothetical protein
MDTSLISAQEYNSLPYVREAHDLSLTDHHTLARTQLLDLINAHGLSNIFSVHLLHKHADAPDGKLMVYELVKKSEHPAFRVLMPRSPRKDEDGEALKAKYFFANASGVMRAYEYSREPMPDIKPYADFCSIFAQKLITLKVEEQYSLGVIPTEQLTDATEIELPAMNATVFVKDLELPDYSAVTDWMNNAWAMDTEGIPINQAKNSNGRCVYHKVGHSAAFWEKDGGEARLHVNGLTLEKDTPAYAVITNAMEYIAVA